MWRDRSVAHCIRDIAELVAERESLACKDFARLLQDQQKEPLNLVWVAYYWQQVGLFFSVPRLRVLIWSCRNQMLQAVHVIHEEKIVHSDLKPANFVLVRGQLKLIDFGIANAIANDTTNIQRDHQVMPSQFRCSYSR